MSLTTEIKLLTGVHDSDTCDRDNGQPCFMCRFATDIEVRREQTEWDTERAMNDFRREFGDERFMEKIEVYLTQNGLY
jgi:hypothetical protein